MPVTEGDSIKNPGKRHLKALFGAVALVLALGLLIVCGLAYHFIIGAPYRQLEEKQRALLSKVNYHELSDAMHHLWQAHEPDLTKGSLEISLEDPALPAAIKSVDPHWIGLFKSGVDIELGGQWGHSGFESFYSDPTADTDRILRKDEFPSKQLLPDLWYYAEVGLSASK